MNDHITACQAGRDFLLHELGKHVQPDTAEAILSHYLRVSGFLCGALR